MTLEDTLLTAARDGDLDAARRCLDGGAPVDMRGAEDRTPLMLAATGGHSGLVEMLIEKGADPNLYSETRKTALMLAVLKGDDNSVRLLLNAGADPNAKDRHADPALLLAVKHGHTYIVRLLLWKGADPDIRGDSGFTAFESAAATGSDKLVKCLLECVPGLSSNKPLLASALRYSAAAGKPDTVKALLAAGAELESRDEDGYTPLMMAALNGQAEMVKALVSAGTNTGAVNATGQTASDCARNQEHGEIADFLDKHWAATVPAAASGSILSRIFKMFWKKRTDGAPAAAPKSSDFAQNKESDSNSNSLDKRSEAPAPDAAPKHSQPTILVVDDEKDVVYLAEVLLKRDGYQVITAYTGLEAYNMLTSADPGKIIPDVILLDIMMPEMDGYTLQAKLQEIDDLRYIPIIILTAKGQMKDLFELSSNIFAFVEKPFEPKNLVKTVKDALASKK